MLSFNMSFVNLFSADESSSNQVLKEIKSLHYSSIEFLDSKCSLSSFSANKGIETYIFSNIILSLFCFPYHFPSLIPFLSYFVFRLFSSRNTIFSDHFFFPGSSFTTAS